MQRLEAGYQSGAETGTARQGGEHAALPAPLWFPLVHSGLIAQDFIWFDSLCATSVIVLVACGAGVCHLEAAGLGCFRY